MKEILLKIDIIIIVSGGCIENGVQTSRMYYRFIDLCTWHMLQVGNLEIIYTLNGFSNFF